MNPPRRIDSRSIGSPDEEDVEVIEQLEHLDDIVFPAIDGDQAALEQAAPAWNKVLTTLGPETVQETRNQYLRYAQSTWKFLCRQTIHQPERILAVLKIILLLTSDDGS